VIGNRSRVGALKRELERIARQDFNADVAWLAKRVLREWLAARAPE
jgi:hypothetical protein